MKKNAETVTRISTSSTGQQGNAQSYGGSLSLNGNLIAFDGYASNLVSGDTNQSSDVFLKNLTTGVVTLVSTNQDGVEGNRDSVDPTLSYSGGDVAFASFATNIANADTGTNLNIFVKDTATGDVTWASAPTGNVVPNGNSIGPLISGNGHYVAFTSYATNLLGDVTNPRGDAFIKNLETGQLTLVSSDAAGQDGNGGSNSTSISGNGQVVIFTSSATNLVAGGTSAQNYQVFVKNLQTGQVQLVSADASGDEATGVSAQGVVSANGRYVAFESSASNLVSGATGENVFLKDLKTGTVTLISDGEDGQAANGQSFNPVISPNGRYVAFDSSASNLVPGNTNGQIDVFVKDLWTDSLSLASIGFLHDGANASSYPKAVSDNGVVALDSTATNLVPSDTNLSSDVFLSSAVGHRDWFGSSHHDNLVAGSSGQSGVWRDGSEQFANVLDRSGWDAPSVTWHTSG